jgi:PAS domain S-box-containing protein
LFEEVIEGVFRTHLDGTIVAANPAFARILGYDAADQLLGTSMIEVFASRDDGDRVSAAWRRGGAIDGVDAELRTRSGEPITVELFGRLLGATLTEPVFLQGFVRDVTARRKMLRAAPPDLPALLRARRVQIADEAKLTSREREVLDLLLLGRTHEEIGRAVGMTARTAKFHQANILDKLGAASRLDLVRIFT